MIRAATPDDVPVLVSLIRELADYERSLDQVVVDDATLAGALFADRPAVFAHVAVDDDSAEVVGFAIWFLNFSTWLGRHGLYLEDLYVRPTARHQGHGRALLRELARIATERGYRRLEWWVLDWNEPAHGFYRSLGALPMEDWTVWRVTGSALGRLGRLGR